MGNFYRLQKNISHNKLEDTVLPKNLALGAENKVVNGSRGGSTFRLEDDSQSGIEIAQGDEYIDRHNMDIPTVMKIDVEGYEHKVLRGLSNTLQRPECRTLFIELHHRIHGEDILSNDEIQNIKDLLMSWGYAIETIQTKSGQENIKAYR